MGNKFTRHRVAVDERYTRVQGLYHHKDLNSRKLRRLILSGQLAPCFPGAEDVNAELDECPICFLFYPSLNRSKCCAKGICTECYLQTKSTHLAQPPQCPFCKTSTYVVEYRGPKSLEEKCIEQAEEQKVIEAKIRIRQQELHEEKERLQRFRERLETDGVSAMVDRFRHNFSNLHGFALPPTTADELESGEHDPHAVDASISNNQAVVPGPSEEYIHQIPTIAGSILNTPTLRDEDFDLGLEDFMVMEAIWLSIQEQAQVQNELSSTQLNSLGMACNLTNVTNSISLNNCVSTAGSDEVNGTRSMTAGNCGTGGLAGAVAALTEKQVVLTDVQGHDNEYDHYGDRQSSENDGNSIGLSEASNNPDPFRRQRQMDVVEGELNQCHFNCVEELNTWIENSVGINESVYRQVHGEGPSLVNDWVHDHSSEVVEVGTSFSSSVPSASEFPWEGPDFLPRTQNVGNMNVLAPVLTSSPVLPQSFEEQMMLAMALSLADAQTQSRR